VRFKEFLENVNPMIFKKHFVERKVVTIKKNDEPVEITLVATNGWIHLGAKDSTQFEIRAEAGLKNQVAWVKFEQHDNHLEALDVVVQPAWRRYGIASEMYKFARELKNDIKPSKLQTAMGKEFWKNKDHSK
jgi:hypothetical protein